MEQALEKWKARWESALLEVLIFQMIAFKPRYGKELIDIALAEISHKIKIPTVYAILNRAKNDGLLEDFIPNDKNSSTRGTERRYYQLTDVGSDFYSEIVNSVKSSIHLLEFKEGKLLAKTGDKSE